MNIEIVSQKAYYIFTECLEPDDVETMEVIYEYLLSKMTAAQLSKHHKWIVEQSEDDTI